MKFTKGNWYTNRAVSVFSDTTTMPIHSSKHYDDEAKYNALLISKAPEMLEMLEYISNETDQICNDSGMGYIVGYDDMDKLRKLIKEATEL